MVMESKQTVHSGHTIQIQIGTTVVGKAQGLEGERSFGTEGVYEIGSIMPVEHVNNRYEGSLTLERFFVRTSDDQKGDLVKAGYASLGEEVLKRDIITIAVYDKTVNPPTLIRSYEGCTIVNYRETFRVNAIAGENATFTYLKSSNNATS